MRFCGKCLRRLVIWIVLTIVCVSVGLFLDLSLFRNEPFPIPVRVAGLVAIILVHPLMKRGGRLLKLFGECELWGWSTELITWDVYRCVRHPHHLGIGLFMTALGFLIGYWITFVMIIASQWTWVVLFVILIEERECMEKFGERYKEYCMEVPRLLCNPVCLVKVLRGPMEGPGSDI